MTNNAITERRRAHNRYLGHDRRRNVSDTRRDDSNSSMLDPMNPASPLSPLNPINYGGNGYSSPSPSPSPDCSPGYDSGSYSSDSGGGDCGGGGGD